MSIRDRVTRRWGVAPEEMQAATRRLNQQERQLEKLSTRFAELRVRLERVAGANHKLRERAERQDGRLTALQGTVKELKESIAPIIRAQNLREVDHGRAMQQLAALEERVGRIEEALESNSYETDDDSLREARSLVDTVRREHDQVRVRFQIISAYEERLRRLEAAVTTMYDGDLRHPL